MDRRKRTHTTEKNLNELKMTSNRKITYEIVRPIEDHARVIMDWRNDPVTLAMSYHDQPKVWNAFWEEFRFEYFSIPELPSLFVICEGKRIGLLRFKPVESLTSLERKSCEISINIASEYRAKGLGTLALTEVCDWLMQQGIDDVYAEVKENNTASHKLFTAAGYQELEKQTRTVNDTGKTFAISVYIKKLAAEKTTQDQVFIIAEAGSNWRMGSTRRDHAMAKSLIDVAIEAGVDAVKFQTYRPETIYVHNAGQSNYLAEAGIQEDISSIFSDLAMPYDMIHELADYCKKGGVEFMSTPFSENDFNAVDPYVRRHKIASYEISHIRLIELVAKSGKPAIFSTGAADEEDISWAVRTFFQNGGRDLTLLQCTAKYPAEPESMNLDVVRWIQSHYHVNAGLSDHSRHPIIGPVSAVALGASVIEKHFTLSNKLPGPDHFFAILPHELKEMVEAIRLAERMRGSGVKIVQEPENELRLFARRGVQALHAIKAGDLLSEGKNLAILRPGNQELGVHPKFLVEIEGKKATCDIKAGSGIKHGDWSK
ncbi:MAG: GNAT family N-acetyltransferase [Chlamydiota bacterium]|nr:GNAT family N-acetyltransferase [Chlamydiota bacterium]